MTNSICLSNRSGIINIRALKLFWETRTILSRVLYEETQGITDLAIKAFIFAQQRAIESGQEKITASIIRSVAKDKFKMLHSALKALKEKDKGALERYEDLYPDLKTLNFQTAIATGEFTSSPEVQSKINNKSSATETEASKTDTSTVTEPNEGKVLPFENKGSNSHKKKSKNADPKSLVNLFQQSKKENSDFYQVLSSNGYIRRGGEFLEGGLN